MEKIFRVTGTGKGDGKRVTAPKDSLRSAQRSVDARNLWAGTHDAPQDWVVEAADIEWRQVYPRAVS